MIVEELLRLVYGRQYPRTRCPIFLGLKDKLSPLLFHGGHTVLERVLLRGRHAGLSSKGRKEANCLGREVPSCQEVRYALFTLDIFVPRFPLSIRISQVQRTNCLLLYGKYVLISSQEEARS